MKFSIITFYLSLLLLTVSEAKHKNYGGKIARYGQFPFVVSLSCLDSIYCGASIIHERWVLTAAHCLFEPGEDKSYMTENTLLDIGTGVYNLKKIFKHPDFKHIPANENNGLEYVVNDVGLIRLTSNVTFDDRVQPIRLATKDDGSYDNATATLPGWGRISYYRRSNYLRYINVRVLPREECQKVWTYADKHICTSTREHQGICYGDSGSPLVVGDVQIGIASTVDGKYCDSLKPDLHMKVSSFLPWIKSIMSRYGDILPDSEDD